MRAVSKEEQQSHILWSLAHLWDYAYLECHVMATEKEAQDCLPMWEGFLAKNNPFQKQRLAQGKGGIIQATSIGLVWAKSSL